MADAPGVQLPFCRNEEQPLQADAAADAIVGRLVAKIAQLEEQLYARDWQGTSDHGISWRHAKKPCLCCCATTALSVVILRKSTQRSPCLLVAGDNAGNLITRIGAFLQRSPMDLFSIGCGLGILLALVPNS
jgi:hypothetical protein